MNKKEKKEIESFPMALDEAIIKKFGKEVKAETYYDLFGSMTYKTKFKATGELRKRIKDFIEGYIQGNLELRERMLNQDKLN